MEHRDSYYDEEEISLSEVYDIIRRNIVLIVVVTLSAALVGLLISAISSSRRTPQIFYQAVTKVKVVVEDEVVDKEKREQVIQVVVDLLKGDTVIRRAADKVGINGELGAIRQDIQISRIDDVLEIIVNGDNREKVEKMVDEILVQGILLINDTLPVQKFDTIQDTRVSKYIVNVAPVVDFKLNTVVGGGLGFIGIIFLIFLKHAIDKRIASEEDIRKCLGLKVLVSIPNCAHDSQIKPRVKQYFRIR
ncbi:MAG TPA: hypothetical protein VIK77_01440 [Tissierellaceae bacterium]